MPITVDPTVPQPTEQSGNGYLRIQALAGAINALFGQSSSAPFTYGVNPFTVDANGNVNVTNGAGFQVGGVAFVATATAVAYKNADQSLAPSTSAADTQLTINVNPNTVWSVRFGVILNTNANGTTLRMSVPAGATYILGDISLGATTAGSFVPSTINGLNYLEMYAIVAAGASGGAVALSYQTSFSSSATIKTGSSLFAAQVV